MAEGTVPYIGSRISLISKSEIRYEGTLYTINTQESTVALQHGAPPSTLIAAVQPQTAAVWSPHVYQLHLEFLPVLLMTFPKKNVCSEILWNGGEAQRWAPGSAIR